MRIRNALDRGIEAVGNLPLIRRARQRAYENEFAGNQRSNLFMGVYDSFESAAASAPATRPVGYDNKGSAEIAYGNHLAFYDYPAMFWLAQSIHAGMRSVFDLGGHVGIKYYAFRRPMAVPSGLRWTVGDVAAVVEHGRKLAQRLDPERMLDFTTDPTAMDGYDVLFASGSLQYLPEKLGDLLRKLASKPKRIVLNITAVHPEKSYFTLNSIGTAFCAYRVQAHGQLVSEIADNGYTLNDSWRNIGKTLELPFHEELNLEYYSGYCFDRT